MFKKIVMLDVKLTVHSLTWDRQKRSGANNFQQCPTNQYENCWISFEKICQQCNANFTSLKLTGFQYNRLVL